METLNALLKEAIIMLDGITYTPQVIKTNNTKGEIVVKIEMQKGTVRATVNFTIVGFTTTSQVQVNLEVALAKIKGDVISGDKNKLPSSMTSELIGALKGFPQTITNEISFSATSKTAIDADGALAIILTITKGDLSQTKELIIRGFKKQSDQAAVEAALKAIDNDTISGHVTKLPSLMTLELIAVLKGFPQTTTNKVFFSVVSKDDVDDTNGQLVIILKATKGDVHKEKSITISGFQTQADVDQATIDTVLEVIDNDTISGNKTKLPSTMNPTSIKTLTSFPPTTSGVHFTVVSIYNDDDTKGQLKIILKATKGDVHKEKSITISGFQTQAQANQSIVNTALKAIDNDTISGDGAQLPSSMNLASIATLKGFPQTTTNKVFFSIVSKDDVDDTNGQLVIILKATKGDASQKKEITISGFQTIDQVDQATVGAALKAIKATHNYTISGDNTKLPSIMNLASIAALTSFPQTTASGVHFSVVSKDVYNDELGYLTITLRAIKGSISQDKSITINGFDSKEAQAIWPKLRAIKKLFDEFGETTINNNEKLVNENIIISKDIRTFFSATGLIIPNQSFFKKLNWKITFRINDATSQLVTFLFSPSNDWFGAPIVTSVIKVSGFTALPKAQHYKAIISAITITTTKESDKLPLAATYNSIAEFNSKTGANLPKPDPDVNIVITWKDNDDNKVVTFTISTEDGETTTHDITVTGFKSQT